MGIQPRQIILARDPFCPCTHRVVFDNFINLWQPCCSTYIAYKPVLQQWVTVNTLPQDIATSYYCVDKDGNGKLEWNNGEIRNFISIPYGSKGLPPPDDTAMYQMYRAFDANNDGGLEMAEAQRMAQAQVLSLCSALGIPTVATVQSPVMKVCPGY